MKIDPLEWFTEFVTQSRADIAEGMAEDEVAPTVIAYVRNGMPCAVALCAGDDPVGYELARIGAGAFDAEEVLVCHDAYMTVGAVGPEVAGELAEEMSKMTLGPKQKNGDGVDVLMVVQARREGDLGLWIHPYKVNHEQHTLTYAEPQDVGAVGFLGGPGAEKLRDTWSTTSFAEFMNERAQMEIDRDLTRDQLDAIVQEMLPQVFPCKLELLREAPEQNLN